MNVGARISGGVLPEYEIIGFGAQPHSAEKAMLKMTRMTRLLQDDVKGSRLVSGFSNMTRQEFIADFRCLFFLLQDEAVTEDFITQDCCKRSGKLSIRACDSLPYRNHTR